MDDDRADLYTPWRESQDHLEIRHVGRENEIQAIVASAHSFATGSRPLPMYLFGPRGVGKSHILVMARHVLEADFDGQDIQVILVPEDIPEQRTAQGLMERMVPLHHGWSRWPRPSVRSTSQQQPAYGKRVVVIEGLDRQLDALGRNERREFRRLLDLDTDIWLIGSGVSLSKAFTGANEAFYGAFDPWPIEPLDDKHAARLLATMAGVAESDDDPRWPARSKALVTLAGGNPRALIALGNACRANPDRWASEQLHQVVHDFTAHYQIRFRDLSPQSQQIVELLAEAPREVKPSELAEILGSSTSQVSVQARRMVHDGVLHQRSKGKATWYRLAEPLFRFWLEYRNASGWEQTRIGWLGRLLESLSDPSELAQAWWRNPDSEIRRAAAQALGRSVQGTTVAWFRVASAFVMFDSFAQAEEALVRSRELALDFGGVTLMASWGKHPEQWELLRLHLRDRLMQQDPDLWGHVLAFVDFAHCVRSSTSSRSAFGDLLNKLRSWLDVDPWKRGRILALFRISAFAILEHGERRGQPWKLTQSERECLASIPYLRGIYLLGGKLSSHPPLLSPADVLRNILDENTVVDASSIFMAGVHLSDTSLIEHSLKLWLAAEETYFDLALDPTRKAPVAADRLIELIERIPEGNRWGLLMGNHPLADALGWVATLVDASEYAWTRLLTVLSRAEWEGNDPKTWHASAFTALALERPERLETLAEALGPIWRETCDQAQLLSESIRDRKHGNLQPELEQLRLAFGAG